MPRNVWSGLYLSSLLAVLSNLSGCIDSRNIVPQAERLAEAELQSDARIREAAEAVAWPDRRWWQAYGDPQLDAWVEQALAGSPDLAMAAARVRQARALAGVAEAAQAPQADFDAAMQRRRWPDDNFYGPGPLARTSTWNNTSTLGLSYDLDLWGRLRSNHERALSLAQVAATEQRAAALELQHNLVRTYIRLAEQHADLDIAEAELRQREQLLELARRRQQMGVGTLLEVSEAEAPLPEAHRRLDLLHEAIALSRNQLAALAGKGPGAGAQLQRPKLSLHAAPELPSNLPLELLGRRPDVVARRWQVAAEARGIEVAKADFYPNINLLGSLGTAATQGGPLDFLKYQKLAYGFGPALSLPIFDGGRRRGQLGAATAGYDLAVEAYNQTLVQALKSVSDSLIRLHSLHEQEGFVRHGLETAERRYRLAEEAYRRGLTDFRRVLEAQSALFEQQRLEQQVQAESLSAQAGLWVALGGGALEAGEGPSEPALEARDIALRFLDRP